MLLEIRRFLIQRGICTLSELTDQFHSDPDAMRGMLSHWVRKGQVIREQSGCSKGCVSCAPEQLEVYRWQAKDAPSLIPVCHLSS